MLEMTMRQGPEDVRRASRALRTHAGGKAIRREFTKALRDGTRPAVLAVRAAALSLPDKPGGPSTGLRRRMAAATSAQVRTGGQSAGVMVRVRRSRMGGQASLAKATDRGAWRHQVFGQDVWVTQTSRRGWFTAANQRSAPPVRRAVKGALDGVERKLSHH